MDSSFKLLKYWRGRSRCGGATVVAETAPPPSETDEDDNEDDGPFFDLELSAKDHEHNNVLTTNDENKEEDGELKLAADETLSDILSFPVVSSDDKAELLPLASFFKLSTKYRFFTLRLRRHKPSGAGVPPAPEEPPAASPKANFFVKLKMEGAPVASLFRNTSSGDGAPTAREAAVAEDKKIASDIIGKYIEKIKPLYVRVSKNVGKDRAKFGELLGSQNASPETKEATTAAAATTADGLSVDGEEKKKVVGMKLSCKRLGKSRSAASGMAMAAGRRDESLVEIEEGIEGAIAHCKQSYAEREN